MPLELKFGARDVRRDLRRLQASCIYEQRLVSTLTDEFRHEGMFVALAVECAEYGDGLHVRKK